MNKLIVAAAGSGKTTYIIDEALKIKGEHVLITTFTTENEKEIKNKLYEKIGYIPKHITVQTWFAFLLQHGVKPYQSVIYDGDVKGLQLVNERSGLKFKNKAGIPFYYGESDPEKFYLNNSSCIYSDKIAKFVVRANEKTNNLVIDRIAKIFSHIFIDEIQDMAGYDLEIIKLLFQSKSNILLVGDPRQVTYHTHDETKYTQYANGEIIKFINNECSKYNVVIDENTLNATYRNNDKICQFANSIFIDKKPCQSNNKCITGHDGVFLISSQDVKRYLLRFNPVQLRDNLKTKIVNGFLAMNMGESKGLTFDRVLIYPTKPMLDWIKDHNKDLKFKSRCKFYVAVTRAKFSVAIVADIKQPLLMEGIEIYKYD